MNKNQSLQLRMVSIRHSARRICRSIRYLPDMGFSEDEIWSAANKLSRELQMDGILAYMWHMITELKKKSWSMEYKKIEELTSVVS